EFKQRPLFLSAALCGRGVGKSYWNYMTGPRVRQAVNMKTIYDDRGNEVMSVPVVEEVKTLEVVRDHSTCEVIDPRDFIVHEAARDLQPFSPGGALHLFHRCF